MPSIKDQSTVNKIAQVFTGEGKRNKAKTLRIMGYAASTCVSGKCREVIYENVRVKTAIAKIDAKAAEKAEFTIVQYQLQLDEDRTLARELKQPSAAVSATVAKGRSCGYDKDNDVSSDQQRELTEAQAVECKRLAELMNRESLKVV